MAMIDTGIVVEVAVEAGKSVPVSNWRKLTDIATMPALIQPSTKIPTDFIGDEFTGEMLGKRAINGLDFVFAYDGGSAGKQYRFFSDFDDQNEKHWVRVTYPDGTRFIILVEFEVSHVAPAASNQLQYTVSMTPHRNDIGELILVIYPEENDPLEADKFTLTYKYQDGETDDTIVEISRGEKAVEPADPERDNYEFKGWYTNSAGEGLPYNFNSSVYSDFTLYAKWELI